MSPESPFVTDMFFISELCFRVFNEVNEAIPLSEGKKSIQRPAPLLDKLFLLTKPDDNTVGSATRAELLQLGHDIGHFQFDKTWPIFMPTFQSNQRIKNHTDHCHTWHEMLVITK